MEIKEPKFDVQKNFGLSSQRPLRDAGTATIEIGESIQLSYCGKPVLVRVVNIEKENEVFIGEIYDLNVEGHGCGPRSSRSD